MTSATKRLRALLDERGVEWDYGIGGAYTTEFSANGVMLNFRDWGDGVICSTILTPEQAVAATLGPGTCHAVFEVDAMSEDDRVGEFVCSECGETFGVGRDQLPHYCPACGKKVVE